MKKRNAIGAFLLTGIMALSMATGVFAEAEGGDTTISTDGSASISKDFVLPDGVAIPDATFSFTAVATGDDAADAPTVTINPIKYSSSDYKGTADADRKFILTQTSEINFTNLKHAGEFTYTVKETIPENKGGVTYSTDEYTMKVHVVNDENSANELKVTNITAEKNGTKQPKIKFTNTYNTTGSLTISKKTTGDLANRKKEFSFKIKFTKSPTVATAEQLTGKVGDKEYQFYADGLTYTDFKLKHGETLTINDIPAGTTYTLYEVGVGSDGYTPQVTLIENGNKTLNEANTYSESEDAYANTSKTANGSALVGENENSVTFENVYNEIAITGVILNNLPFILLIGIGVCALALLAVSKKRRTENR